MKLSQTLLCFLIWLIFFPSIILAHSQTQIVKMTKEGFEPQNLTLDTSSAVIFLNEDTSEHWPASDLHPTHEIYPEFDPKHPIGPGESWSFKPKRVGIFKYHDHLNPHVRATLEVTTEKSNLTNAVDNSSSISSNWTMGVKSWFGVIFDKIGSLFHPNDSDVLGQSKFNNLSPDQQFKVLREVVDKEGVEKVWQDFKEKYQNQSGTVGNIHALAHLIGSLIFEKKDFPGLSICSSEFAFGCYHGFLDKAFQKSLDNLPQAEMACKSLGNQGPFASCIHGIGHGVASFYQASDLPSSLKSCSKLNSGVEYCFDGVLMEFTRAAPVSFYQLTKPYFPCDELEPEFGTDFAFACGRNQLTVLRSRFNYPTTQVIRTCLEAESTPFKQACFDAFGFSISSTTSNPTEIIRQCQEIEVEEFIVRCAKAAAGELIFQNVPDWQKNAPVVCQALSNQYKTECQEYLKQLMEQYSRS